MPLHKGTIFFEQLTSGWTESYWKTHSSDDANFFIDDLTLLAQKRIKMSGTQTKIMGLRMSIEGVFRDASIFFPNPLDLSYQGHGSFDSDPPFTALLFRMSSQKGIAFTFRYLRGIWDSQVVSGGGFSGSAAWQTQYNLWLAELQLKQWGWLAADVRKKGFVTAAVQNANGTVRVTVTNDIFAGQIGSLIRVRLSGVRGASALNGTHLFVPSSATVADTYQRMCIFPYTAGGKATYTTTAFTLPTTFKIQRVVERKVGRPSYQLRGRRRAMGAA